MTHARCPSPLAGRDAACCSRNAADRSGVDAAPLPEGPREGLLDLVVGVAHELADERQRRAVPGATGAARAGTACGIRASVAPTSRRSMRAFGVDQLLQLRPAEWLREDALGVHLGEACPR